LTVKAIRELTTERRGGVDLWGDSALTLVLPIKSPNHFAVLSRSLTQSLPQLYAALDTIGTVYFLRFVPWGTHAMVLVAEHDFSLEQLAHDLSKHLGPMFDEVFENVIDSSPTPMQGTHARIHRLDHCTQPKDLGTLQRLSVSFFGVHPSSGKGTVRSELAFRRSQLSLGLWAERAKREGLLRTRQMQERQ